MRKQNGFTLIELIILIAISAILFAIAYPAYRDYKARRNGTDVNMGTQGGTVSMASQNLVCKDSAGNETSEFTIPGQRWYFEGGAFVTTDANGNPVVRSAAGKDCEIR